MYIDGDRLTVALDSDLAEVIDIASFVKERIDFIEGVDLEGEAREEFMTSAIFQLLCAMKVAKPSLDIPLFSSEGLALKKFGVLHWEAAWTKNN
ncbi:MAG: hypothetical protein LBU73_09955 [Helicobacteraceae bacterium]|jgi:hypothetical protein|nr:hypothetical protein [Helicobacteraceae bacterium]